MSDLVQHITATLNLGSPNDQIECDNCFTTHSYNDLVQFDHCLIHALLSWAVHYNDLTPEEALDLLPRLCPDRLWDAMHTLLSDMQAGTFDYDPTT